MSGQQRPNPLAEVCPDDRPLPFTLRVAVEWSEFKDVAEFDDGSGYFLRRGRLTGDLVVTAGGLDIEFCDIGTPQ
jgi:hypothetical protein